MCDLNQRRRSKAFFWRILNLLSLENRNRVRSCHYWPDDPPYKSPSSNNELPDLGGDHKFLVLSAQSENLDFKKISEVSKRLPFHVAEKGLERQISTRSKHLEKWWAMERR